MEVEINKRTVTVDAETVPTLAALLKAEGRTLITENIFENRFRQQWAEIPLREGMKITVIRAVCGG